MSRGRPRRTKGEGSIWPRKDGRFGASAVVLVGGVKKRRSITRNTREEVLAELRKLQAKGRVASGKGTFGEWLDEWLEEVKVSLRPKTYESYEAVVRLHLKPSCGSVKLAKLGSQHITAAVKRARVEKLSTSSQAYIRTVARIALERALKLGRVTENVAKLSATVKVEQAEILPFSDAEFAAYMNAIPGSQFEAAFLLALLMGPRKGEILGLQWSDLVERQVADGATITELRIARQVQRVGGRLIVVPVKTKRSRRAITLPQEVVDALRRHRTRQLEQRLRAGVAWHETGHIFATRHGKVVDPRNLLRSHYAIQAKAKIALRRSFHALRHSAATDMLAAGVPIKAISALLGHSHDRFTQERYTHLVPALEAQVVEAASARAKKK